MQYFCRIPVGTLLLGVTLSGLLPGTPPVAAQPAPPPLQWAACDDIPGVECAAIEVPVDHARPDGVTGRLPTTDPAQKRGSLLIIPGGPGPGIRITLVDYGAYQHVDEQRRYFDVVSFDPRPLTARPGARSSTRSRAPTRRSSGAASS
jgi:hypothetical protein